MRGWAAALTAVACAGCAMAAGYDDFCVGMTALMRNDGDEAIAAFTAALNAGDLVEAYVPLAHRGRGIAYLNNDKCAETLADFNATLAAKGHDDELLAYRMQAELCLKDLAAAQKDYDSLTVFEKEYFRSTEFGRMEWEYGFFAEASANFAKDVKHGGENKDQNDPYAFLWQIMSADRAGALDKNAAAAIWADIRTASWPAPIVDLYLGKLTPDQLLGAASSMDPTKDRYQTCSAKLYLAEWHLARNAKDAALPLLQTVAKDCRFAYYESHSVRVELKRLGVTPPEADEEE